MPDRTLPSVPAANLLDTVEWVAEDSLLFADERAPFEAHVTVADPAVVVVAGENASGKSLFFRAVAARIHQAGLLPVTISIRERSGAGEHEMAGFRRVFMFGDEQEQSTGATSVKAVVGGFRNLNRERGTILGLDEPELGLSDGYARALGQWIGVQSRNIPAACAGVMVVTHSRSLVAGLADSYGTAPTFVYCGNTPVDLGAWLATPERRSVEELLALPEVGLDRWRTVASLLDASRKTSR